MFASFVWLMRVIIRISSSISSSLLTPNELDIRFQELSYPEKLSSNKNILPVRQAPKYIFTTVFLNQALETALTSNLCFKTLWSEQRLAILHVSLWLEHHHSSGHDKEGWNEVISCQIQRRDTKQNLQPQIVFIPGSSMMSLGLTGSLPLSVATRDILMETILIPPLTRALLR